MDRRDLFTRAPHNPSPHAALGELAKRIAALEAVLHDAGIRFNTDNQGGWLDIQANDADGDGYGFHFNDDTGDNGSLWEVEQSLKLATQDEAVYVLIRDAFGGMTLHSADRVLIDAESFKIAPSTDIDGGGNKAENFADGVAATDLATVGQIGTAIRGEFANTPGYLNVETDDVDGDGYGIQLSDTDNASNGIWIKSAFGQVVVSGTAGAVLVEPGGGAGVRVVPGGVEGRLPSSGTFTVFDSSSNPIFRVDDDGDLHGKTGKALTFDL